MLCLYFAIIIATCGLIIAAVFLPEKFEIKPQQIKLDLQQDVKEIVQKSYSRYSTNSFANTLIDKIQEDFQCCGASNYTDWFNSLQNNATRPDIGVGSGTVTYIQASPSPQFQQQTYYGQQNQQPMSQSPTVTTTFRVPGSCCSTRFNENSYNQCKSMISRYDANPSEQQVQRIPNVNQDGCVDKIYNYLFVVNWWPLNIIGGLAIGLQGLSLIFSLCLCCAINRAFDNDEDYEEK